MGLRDFFSGNSTVEGSKKDEVIDYDFKCITPVEYETELKMCAKSRTFNYIFRKAKQKLSRKGINFSGSLKDVQEIEVPQSYLKLIGTIINNTLKKIEKEVKEDGGIIVKSWLIVGARFLKNKNQDFTIIINIKGDYIGRK